MPATTDTTRCLATSEHGLGCARTAGHTGAHWLTGRPAEARAELRRDGFFSDTPEPSGWDYNLTTCYRLGCTETTTPTLRYCREHYR